MTRRVLLSLAALLVLLVAAGAIAALTFDPDSLKPRITEAVQRATGRELTLGRLRLGWSLTPTVVAEDVRLANPPGFSRPDLLRVARIEARVALLPLLSRRVELRNVVLAEPDLLLEQDAAGRPNWRFDRPAPPPTSAPASASAPRSATEIDLRQLILSGGRLAFRRGTAEPVTVSVGDFVASPVDDSGSLVISANLRVRDVSFRVHGLTGPASALTDTSRPWPVRFEAAATGLDLLADGTIGPGGDLRVEAKAADLAALSPLVAISLPPLRDVHASARLVSGAPAEATLRIGASDLAPGIRLVGLAVQAPALDQSITLNGAAELQGKRVQLAGSLGTLAALLSGGPWPVDLRADAGDGAVATARGAVSDPRALRGLDVALSARVPDLALLGPASGDRLPPWRDLAFDARLTDPAGLAAGVALRAMRLALPQGDLAGDLAITWSPRPSLRGTLVSQRLDADALRAALRPAPQPAAPAAPAAPAPRARLFTDEPLQLDPLRRADADLNIELAELVWGGTTFRGTATRLLLQSGRLRLDPFTTQPPGGRLYASMLLDASQPQAAFGLQLQAPGTALGPLLAALGRPDGGTGTLQLDAELQGTGNTPHAIAATASGHIGASLVDGELEGAVLAGLGEALRAANLPVDLNGRVRLRCLALRAELTGGQADLRALLLDTTRLRVEGAGSVNLADEILALQLRPLLRLGGTGVAVPVRVGGTLLAPRFALDAGSGRVGATIGALGAAPTEDCAPQLALARGGRPGPAPETPLEAPRPLRPADLLRSLIR